MEILREYIISLKELKIPEKTETLQNECSIAESPPKGHTCLRRNISLDKRNSNA